MENVRCEKEEKQHITIILFDNFENVQIYASNYFCDNRQIKGEGVQMPGPDGTIEATQQAYCKQREGSREFLGGLYPGQRAPGVCPRPSAPSFFTTPSRSLCTKWQLPTHRPNEGPRIKKGQYFFSPRVPLASIAVCLHEYELTKRPKASLVSYFSLSFSHSFTVSPSLVGQTAICPKNSTEQSFMTERKNDKEK